MMMMEIMVMKMIIIMIIDCVSGAAADDCDNDDWFF